MTNRFEHNGACGDIVYSLPTVEVLGGGDFYIRKHDQYNVMRRLVERQPYITRVVSGRALSSYYNLSLYRIFADSFPHMHLVECHLHAFKLQRRYDTPWLHNIPSITTTKIVINRTPRYHGDNDFDWALLKHRIDDVTFIGCDEDYADFKSVFGFAPKRFKCADALDIAGVIKGSKLFIGNQSLCYAVAEGLKVNRVLEVCSERPNCMPTGGRWAVRLTEEILKHA